MISTPSSSFPPPKKEAHPILVLSDDWTIRESSAETAALLGLSVGHSLLPYLDEQERQYHTACLRHLEGCDFDPLRTVQSSALFRLNGLPPYTLLYARYLHTLKSAVLHAALFSTRRDYLHYISGEDPHGMYSIDRCGWELLLTESTASAMERRLGMAAMQLSALKAPSGAERPLYSLTRVITIFFEEILPRLYPMDAHVERMPQEMGDWYAPLLPHRFFLLLAVLACAMDTVSESRIIQVFLKETALSGDISFATGCFRLCRVLYGSADLYVLATLSPHRSHLWSLAESLLAEAGHDVRLRQKEQSVLSVDLLIGAVPTPDRFHSSSWEERTLRDAARDIGKLLDHQQKQ